MGRIFFSAHMSSIMNNGFSYCPLTTNRKLGDVRFISKVENIGTSQILTVVMKDSSKIIIDKNDIKCTISQLRRWLLNRIHHSLYMSSDENTRRLHNMMYIAHRVKWRYDMRILHQLL